MFYECLLKKHIIVYLNRCFLRSLYIIISPGGPVNVEQEDEVILQDEGENHFTVLILRILAIKFFRIIIFYYF